LTCGVIRSFNFSMFFCHTCRNSRHVTLTLSLHSVVHCATALRSCCVCCACAALRRGCAVQLRRRFLPAALTPYAVAQRQISPLVTLVFEET
jgi:hypothetical protein